MAIPDYQTIMLPLLKFVSDNQEHKTRDAIEQLSNEFGLNEEDSNKLLPSGQQAVIDNRVGWARTYLLKAGLLSAPKKGYIKISDRGLEILKQNPEKINVKFLEQFREFRFQDFRKMKSNQCLISILICNITTEQNEGQF